MKKLFLLLTLFFAFTLIGTAQKKYKPWMEWNEKEATKMLNDSPWGLTQTESNTSEMFFTPGAGNSTRAQRGGDTSNTGGLTNSNDRSTQGSVNQAVNLNYRIRFLSARPIRQAFARRLILENPSADAQLKAFAEQTSADFIVVAVDYDTNDQRFTGRLLQAFNSAVLSTLVNNTYLETKDGKRLFVKDYKAPINDGMGAKFVFPRTVEGQPFVKEDSGYVRFYSEITKDVKVNMRFKVSDMMYDGKLEY